MTESPEIQNKIRKFEEDVLHPLIREERYDELCEQITQRLSEETDPDFRYELKSDLITVLHLLDGAESRCIRAGESLVEEFPDHPLAWLQLAKMYFYVPKGQERTPEGTSKAFQYFDKALYVARERDEWVRYVLFDLCRAFASMTQYDELELVMREIMEDLAHTRRLDIPKLEGDWLRRIPRGSLDGDLIERYIDLCHRSAKRWQELGDTAVTIPTLADLDRE